MRLLLIQSTIDIALAVVQSDVAAEMTFELSSFELLGDHLSGLM